MDDGSTPIQRDPIALDTLYLTMYQQSASNVEAAKQWHWTLAYHSVLLQAGLVTAFTLWDGTGALATIGRFALVLLAVVAAVTSAQYVLYSGHNVDRHRREQRAWRDMLPSIVGRVSEDAEYGLTRPKRLPPLLLITLTSAAVAIGLMVYGLWVDQATWRVLFG